MTMADERQGLTMREADKSERLKRCEGAVRAMALAYAAEATSANPDRIAIDTAEFQLLEAARTYTYAHHFANRKEG
jgi:hypothetical protein